MMIEKITCSICNERKELYLNVMDKQICKDCRYDLSVFESQDFQCPGDPDQWMDETCEGCRFAQEENNEVDFECRNGPPTLAFFPLNNSPVSYYPTVGELDMDLEDDTYVWTNACAEWKPKGSDDDS